MDFLATPLGVLVILGVVAVAAFKYEPAKYVGVWREIATLYETNRRPPSVTFTAEGVSMGKLEYAYVDAALNDEGFWMMYSGPDPKKAPECVLIPWDCIRFKEEGKSGHNFEIRLKKPLEFHVSPGLGAALRRRSQSMPSAAR
jgi:hypothetical protein